MPADEELREHAEHAHDQFSRKAAATMAIIAAFLAVVAVFAQMNVTSELLNQQKATDQWAYYQAKSLRRYQSEVARDTLSGVGGPQAASLADKYSANFERYDKESKDVQDKATEFERASELAGHRALHLHMGEIFLELAIVFSSLAILARRSFFWYTGIASGLAGVLVSATALLVTGA
jgi:Domain of unknown function (DUF4337)